MDEGVIQNFLVKTRNFFKEPRRHYRVFKTSDKRLMSVTISNPTKDRILVTEAIVGYVGVIRVGKKYTVPANGAIVVKVPPFEKMMYYYSESNALEVTESNIA